MKVGSSPAVLSRFLIERGHAQSRLFTIAASLKADKKPNGSEARLKTTESGLTNPRFFFSEEGVELRAKKTALLCILEVVNRVSVRAQRVQGYLTYKATHPPGTLP